MALPLLADLQISRGADFNFTLRILDAKGDPVALTGGLTSFKAEIRQGFKKPKIAAFTITAQTGNDAGDLLFQLTDTQTLLLDPHKEYQWDCFWTDTSGVVYCLARGAVVVDANITYLA